ncbi:MAG TPA: glycosyltransferase [Gemmatimonadales bacterium]
MTPPHSAIPRVSIILSTFDRSALLPGALAALREQADAPPYEILVVDNNSTDETASVVAAAAAEDPRIRYIFEPRQGLSHARNAGIAAAAAPVLAFTDDDVRADRHWVRAIAETFERHRDAWFVGGRVLPRWPAPPPAWLTERHWAPLALCGVEEEFRSDAAYPYPLVGASLAVRREVFARLGHFAAEVQRVRDGIGSSEDHDFLLRAWAAGGHGIYSPRIVVTADVQPERMERAYHRRWHRAHGRFAARMTRAVPPGTERRHAEATLFDLPAWFYRRVAAAALDYLKGLGRAPAERQAQREHRLLQLVAYVGEHARGRAGGAGWVLAVPREVARFGAALVRKKLRRGAPAPPNLARRRTDIYAFNGF